MRIASLSIAALLLAAGSAGAQDFLGPLQDFVEDIAPQRPAPRPAAAPVAPPPVEEPEMDEPPPLPRPRPEAVEAEPVDVPVSVPQAVPAGEPGRVYQTACPALLGGLVVGEMLAPIAEGVCEEASPLSISAVKVNGREIGFSSPLTTNCEMAGAFAAWVGEVDLYAGAALDSSLASVVTGTSFMCRNRNGAEDGFVSEHGFANAVDVVGFTLEDGRQIGVEENWMPATAAEGRLLRQAHGAACGRFTTVLGPEANAEHEDHLHLDLGCHGQTCTAQICE